MQDRSQLNDSPLAFFINKGELIMTTENKFLSSLSYLSIFFMPILFPVIVIALTGSEKYQVAHHNSISAFWIHLIAGILVPVSIFVGFASVAGSVTDSGFQISSLFLFGISILMLVIAAGLFIYNLYRGVKIWVQ
jgi:hypothetical protein